MNKVITVFNIKGGVGSTSFVHMLSSHIGCNVYEEKPDYFTYLGCGQIIDPEKVLPGIYDINAKQNGQLISIVLAKSDIVIIPTHFGFMDITKTCSSISLVLDATRHRTAKPTIYVLFNNLSSASKTRERKYRDKAKEDIFQAISGMYSITVAQAIKYLYFRKSFAVFRDSEYGKTLLDHYFSKEADKTILLNNEHLEILYQYIFHKFDDIEPFIHNIHYLLYSNPKFIDYFDASRRPNEDSFTEQCNTCDFDVSTKSDPQKIQHEFDKKILSRLYDLNFLDKHRKPIRDLRNLLIAIGEYLDE